MGKVGGKLPIKLGKEKIAGIDARTVLAGLAMNGILARGSIRTPEEVAELSVHSADAVLAELKK